MPALATRRRSADPVAPRPAIRLRPAPPLEPPFDDELSPQTWAMAGAEQLALDWLPRPGAVGPLRAAGPAGMGVAPAGAVGAPGAVERGGAARPYGGTTLADRDGAAGTGTTEARAGAAVAGARAGAADVGAGDGAVGAGGRGASAEPAAIAGASPDSRAAARRFTAMCLEILNGYRPTGHVRPFVTPAEAPLVIEQLT
ncbi:MAG TPA: hypothetical protein VFR67_22575, partial [Pilimelia sp.]|nr:hypothetical protein [Pilimelia sp.]